MRSNASAGFTLIEILMALALLGTAAIVLLNAHYGAMRLFMDTRDEVVLEGFMEQALGIDEQCAPRSGHTKRERLQCVCGGNHQPGDEPAAGFIVAAQQNPKRSRQHDPVNRARGQLQQR